jgi:hypothetical protein
MANIEVISGVTGAEDSDYWGSSPTRNEVLLWARASIGEYRSNRAMCYTWPDGRTETVFDRVARLAGEAVSRFSADPLACRILAATPNPSELQGAGVTHVRIRRLSPTLPEYAEENRASWWRAWVIGELQKQYTHFVSMAYGNIGHTHLDTANVARQIEHLHDLSYDGSLTTK